MILHLLDDEKFTNQVVELFEGYFPNKSIYLVGVQADKKRQFIIEQNPKLTLHTIGSNSYIRVLEEAQYDLVIIHGFTRYKRKLLLENRLKGKKALFLWGAELYSRVWSIRKDTVLQKTKKAELFMKLFSSKIVYLLLESLWEPFLHLLGLKTSLIRAFEQLDIVLTNIHGDYQKLLSVIDSVPKHHWFTYYGIEQMIHPSLKSRTMEGNNILIGNSATFTNNHLEAFDMIKDIVQHDRDIVVPLSYGNKLYAKKINEVGERYFGERFNSLMNFMPLDEYHDILASCSTVIFNHVRQQGAGNITVAVYLGKKVFLREENTIYQYLQSLGVKVFEISQLNEQSLNSPLSEAEKQSNKRIMEKEFGSDRLQKEYQAIFKDYL